ncbi:MAG: primosomal protein N' [Bacteroidales bacterium]
MQTETLFAEIVLPLPLPGTFTYRIPVAFSEKVFVGQRVIVQFGRKKIYSGLVYEIHTRVPQFETKYILEFLDQERVVNTLQFSFWKWISDYYMSELGEVMNIALPVAMKLASETKVSIHPDFIPDTETLSDREFLITEALMIQPSLTLTEVSKILSAQNIMPLIKGMIEKQYIVIEEELKERQKPKLENYIRLNEQYKEEGSLKDLFDSLQSRAFKQLEVLMAYISISKFYSAETKEVKKIELQESSKASSSIVASMIKKGIFEVYSKEISRIKSQSKEKNVEDIVFSDAQNTAFEQIEQGLLERNAVLLHGVTGSGKTEIYIRLIQSYIDQNKQVLYLLPEIALSSQIINRLQVYFGEMIGVYHSRFNPQERAEIWNKMLECERKSKPFIILGPRSALFLPYSNLGLVIIDEEHDLSYKQSDLSPRYNARDAAIYLAHLHKAKVLLGSATPSLESYYNARHAKYGFVELKERYGGIQLPEILIADIKKESRRKTMHSHYSSFLLSHIKEALKNNEQVILFQNRRGFSTRLECSNCNWIPTCRSCDVSLIYHKYQNRLKCHYCGYSIKPVDRCPVCGSQEVHMKGFGTEKIEEELSVMLPEARIKRMDLDTTRGKFALGKLISDFESRKIDVLVGTQMVTKGLDFDNVRIVGILNADNMLNFPDFRSYERAFQMMSQVSGRAGRKGKRGKVIIQTFTPWHQAIRDVMENNYISMYQSQILERRNFYYPPFFRLIEIKLKDKDNERLVHAANDLAKSLRELLPGRILGPEYPMIPKIRDYYIKSILIKMERNIKLGEVKGEIRRKIFQFKSTMKYRSVIITLDVDPQ